MRELFAWSFSYVSLSIGQANINAQGPASMLIVSRRFTEIAFMFPVTNKSVQIALKIIHHHFQSFITGHEAAVCEREKWTLANMMTNQTHATFFPNKRGSS